MYSKENKDNLSKKRLLVVARSGLAKKNDVFFANPNEGAFLDELAKFFEEITLCVNIYKGYDLEKYPQNFEAKTYQLDTKNITIVELETSSYINIFGKIIQYYKKYLAVKRASKGVDYFFFFSTGYLGILSSIIASVSKIPSIVYVGGDWSDLILFRSMKANLAKRFILKIYSRFIRIIQDFSRNSANIRLIRGDELFTRYKIENSYKLPPMTNIKRENIRKYDEISTKKEEKIRVLFVGRMEIENGIHDFINACKIIKDNEAKQIEINIVGQGPLFEEAKELAGEYGIQANFLGYIENGQELLNVYRKNSILVIPVLRAGLPRVLIEGMSQGLSIIASETGGIPHLVSHGENGLLFQAGNHEKMAESIQTLINDRNLREKFSKAGIEIALSQITDQTAAEFTAEKICLNLNN
tara:strand:+ start:936 stop:2174 length:1239 start_codon:yes stop_codon:yes gene_type:complete